MPNRRQFITTSLTALTGLGLATTGTAASDKKGTKYARFQIGKDKTAYGLVEGDSLRVLKGTFGKWEKTDQTYKLAEVSLLVPTRPRQVFAMAGNYKSHLAGESIPPKFQIPQLFYKPYSCLVPHGANIVLPKGSSVVHHEAEMVVVISKRTKKVSKAKALEHVLGVTCGNDVSERVWQNDETKKDVQWWRAKGADTFGPCGPFIVAGIPYDDLHVEMRVNGQVKQSDSTKNLIHDVAAMVSYISHFVTLHTGDLIYTGTPGKTSAIKPGDVCEVEIEGIGVLRNPVVGDQVS
jgi:2-keto-4-pentenoate hydratase/2-oxohepta-3-ene-1,7-dioic acid hydratase in catechol pathway